MTTSTRLLVGAAIAVPVLFWGTVWGVVLYYPWHPPPSVTSPEIRPQSVAMLPRHEAESRRVREVWEAAGFEVLTTTRFNTCLSAGRSEMRYGPMQERCVLTEAVVLGSAGPRVVRPALSQVEAGLQSIGWEEGYSSGVRDAFHPKVPRSATSPRAGGYIAYDHSGSGEHALGPDRLTADIETRMATKGSDLWLQAPDLGTQRTGATGEDARAAVAAHAEQHPGSWFVYVELDSTYAYPVDEW